MGRATDEDLKQYARKITFTEELMQGSRSAKLQELAKKIPLFQFFIPFIRHLPILWSGLQKGLLYLVPLLKQQKRCLRVEILT